jgi:hypothetical protein
VQRHGRDDGVVAGGEVGAPAGGGHVDADLHEPVDPGGGGEPDGGVDAVRTVLSRVGEREVEVGVAVQDRPWQRRGRRGELAVAAGGRRDLSRHRVSGSHGGWINEAAAHGGRRRLR